MFSVISALGKLQDGMECFILTAYLLNIDYPNVNVISYLVMNACSLLAQMLSLVWFICVCCFLLLVSDLCMCAQIWSSSLCQMFCGGLMPRLNRTLVLALLISFSSIFLLFQLYYYRQYASKVMIHNINCVQKMLKCSNFQIQICVLFKFVCVLIK